MTQYSREHIQYLWQQFVDSKATEEELNSLLRHISDNNDKENDVDLLEAYLSKMRSDDAGDKELFAENLRKILQSQPETFSAEEPLQQARIRKMPLLKMPWLRYAAVLVVMFGIGFYFYKGTATKNEKSASAEILPKEKDILPGSDKAILTLSSGEKVNLNAEEKVTIVDGELAISNNKGELRYEESNVVVVVYNTVSTPKGGQYRLTLPDDTKVWLNAASSITFPTSFPGKVRSVSVTGEAYFEVAHNASKPFWVTVNGKEKIEVLGTHFNVHAYTDEDKFKTSLLEGAIRIGHEVLAPGQAYLNGKIVSTDLAQDVAWKDGVFNLNKMELKEIMLQFSRWYDIEVIYKGEVPKTLFYGEIGRDLSLSEALKGLEDSKIKFRIEQGKKIIVNP